MYLIQGLSYYSESWFFWLSLLWFVMVYWLGLLLVVMILTWYVFYIDLHLFTSICCCCKWIVVNIINIKVIVKCSLIALVYKVMDFCSYLLIWVGRWPYQYIVTFYFHCWHSSLCWKKSIFRYYIETSALDRDVY